VKVDREMLQRGLAGVLLLAVLPTAFFVVVLHLRQLRGPSWLVTWADPDYIHLFNAALAGNLQAPVHTDNPGTPLHALGGAIFRAQHATLGQGPFLDDVVTRPEWYLAAFHLVLLSAIAAAYFFAGIVVWHSAKSILAALLVQFGPWCFWTITTTSTAVMPDALVNALAALFAAVLVREYYTPLSNRRSSLFNVVLLGAIAGVAIATKVTSLPLVAAPLICLQARRDRGLFLVVTAGAFLVGTAPILGRIDRLGAFINRCVTHTGQYGTGPAGFDLRGYFAALATLLGANKLAVGVILLTWIALLAAQFTGVTRDKRWGRTLLALAVAQSCAFLLAAKGGKSTYAVAALGMIGVNVWLLWQGTLDVVRAGKVGRLPAVLAPVPIVALIVTAAILQVRNIQNAGASLKHNRAEREQVAAEAETLRRNGCTIVYGHWASSPANALYFGNSTVDGRLSAILAQCNPDAFFIPLDGKLVDWKTQELNWREFLANHKRAALQGDSVSTAAVGATALVRLSEIDRVSPNACPFYTEGIYRLDRVDLTGRLPRVP
jgi:hypothetical protein